MFNSDSKSCITHTHQPCITQLPPDVIKIVVKHAHLVNASKWHESLFTLQQELDPTAKAQSWPDSTRQAVVALWVDTCKSNSVDVPGFDSAWAQLKRQRKVPIKKPFGSELEQAKARALSVTVPPALEHASEEPVARAMIALKEAAVERGQSEFFAPFEKIAEVAGLSNPVTAQRHLRKLKSKGYVSRLKCGTKGTFGRPKASEWEWYDPPRPGETVWN